jgi:hypothetical protein
VEIDLAMHDSGMDQELLDLIKPKGLLARFKKSSLTMAADMDKGEVLLDLSGEPRHYKLKPLEELYGPGRDVATVDPKDDQFMPLFLAIEEAIAQYYRREKPQLTDGATALVVDQLGMGPESPSTDPLALRIQFGLRLCLSLNNYSRQEVKAALKKIGKSIDRHTRADGPRGYLEFIAAYFAR